MINVYMEESQVLINKKIVFLSLKIDFVLANSADPDEMPQSGSSLFVKVPIWGFLIYKGFKKLTLILFLFQ